jgi:hypothetical protein
MAKFVEPSPLSDPETAVDLLDVNAAVLNGFDAVRDLNQLARGFGNCAGDGDKKARSPGRARRKP